VAEHFGDAHVGDVLCTYDAPQARGFHGGPAEAGKGCAGKAAVEFRDDLGAVVVAGCFAGGEEDARVGCRADASSLSPRCNAAPPGYDRGVRR
jgi:hypothetical protein